MKYSNLDKKIIKKILFFLFFVTLALFSAFISFYGNTSITTSALIFSISVIIFVTFLNRFIIYLYSQMSDKDNLFIPYIVLRSARLPLITLLYISFLRYLIKQIGYEYDFISNYFSFLYGTFEYIIIIIFSWASLRVSKKIKERKINEYFLFDKKKDIDVEELYRYKHKTTNIEAGFKVLNFIIFIITIAALVNAATGSTSGILTFAGGLIIVFGLSARDFLSNFFGGFMIYMNRPFDIGDLINMPDKNIEGVVLEIGWTAVKVRTPDKRPLYIPNSLFSSVSVENSSRMNNRAIRENFKFKIDNFEKISKICKLIKKMLSEHQGIDQNNNIIVNITSFADDYVEISIVCFTKTIEIKGYHSIKQNILIKIYEIIKENEVYLVNRSINNILNEVNK